METRGALTLKDLFPGVRDLSALKSKSAEGTERAIKFFVGDATVNLVYSDKSGETKKACTTLKILHEPSLLGVPQNNAVAERNNLDILDETRAALIQAGFPSCFWPFAAPRGCFLDNTRFKDEWGDPIVGGSAWAKAHGNSEFE